MENLGSEFIIGLSTFILALLGFLQFVLTHIKSTSEKISQLEREKRDLEDQIDDLNDEVDKWKKRAVAERKTRKKVGQLLTVCNERIRTAHKVYAKMRGKIAELEKDKEDE